MQQNQVACTHKSQLLGICQQLQFRKNFKAICFLQLELFLEFHVVLKADGLVNVYTQSRLFFKNIESLQYVYLFQTFSPCCTFAQHLIRSVGYIGVQMISKLQYFCPHNQNVLYLTRDVLETCLRGDRRSGNLVGKDLCCGNNLFLCN